MSANALSSTKPAHRLLTVLALALAVLGEVMVLATVALWLITGLIDEWDDLVRLGDVIMAFASCGVAALILYKHPRHRIGWLLVGIGVLWAYSWFGEAYGWYTYISRLGKLPGVDVILWSSGLTWGTGYGLLIWVLLLFPTGRLLAPRWAWVGGIAMLVLVAGDLLYGIASWRYRTILLFDLRIAKQDAFYQFADQVGTLSSSFAFLCTLVALIPVVLRLRQASGVARQQLKWFVYGAAYLVVARLTWTFLTLYFGLDASNQLLLKTIWRLFYIVAPGLLPITIGFAILRYRLWDIDILIRRTLIYSVLTSLLALVYFGSVVLLESLFHVLIGQGQSQFIIIFSTLVIAALFTPLRHRVQDSIDRRFYRRKYDAGQILTAFTTTVRNETDLDHLTAGLLVAVQETMQPGQMSLWLRASEDRRLAPP